MPDFLATIIAELMGALVGSLGATVLEDRCPPRRAGT
jgi:hypothetical protein